MQMEKLVTKNRVEHGLLETIANSIKDTGFSNLSEKNKKEMIERKKRDLELVKVKYQNLTNQENGKFEGWYGDYPGEPLRAFRFLHGQSYVVPKGFARKINSMGAPVRSGLVDSNGQSIDFDGEVQRSHQMVLESDF